MPDEITREEIIEQLQPFFKKKPNLTTNTKNNYIFALKKYCNYLNYSIPVMVKEANEEQISYINEKNQIIHPELDKTNLKYYLDNFQEDLMETLKPDTVRKIMINVKAVYRELGSDELRMPQTAEITNIVVSEVKLTQRKISKVIGKANPKYQALLCFMGCTGIRVSDAIRFTLEDWKNAVEKETFHEAIYTDDDLNGFFEFIPKKTKSRGNICQTFNTPESNAFIQNYLKQRELKGEILTDETRIFPFTLNHNPVAINIYCTNISVKLQEEEIAELKRLLEEEKISKEQYEKEIKNISYVHPHGFRKYFISRVSNYCANLKVASLFEGHSLPIKTDKHYVGLTRDELWEHYKKVMPYLTFTEEIKIRTIDDKEIEDLKLRIQQLENMKNDVGDDELSEYFKDDL